MAELESWQVEPVPGRLYRVKRVSNSFEGKNPALSAIGGTINVYGSQNEPAALINMALGNAAPFSGFDNFKVIPNYLFIESVSDSPVVVLADFELEDDLGPF